MVAGGKRAIPERRTLAKMRAAGVAGASFIRTRWEISKCDKELQLHSITTLYSRHCVTTTAINTVQNTVDHTK